MLACWAGQARALDPVWQPLRVFLLERGLPPREADAMLNHPGVHLEAQLLARMLSAKEKPRDYQQFFKPETIAKAQAFSRRYAKTLSEARVQTGVPGSVVVAILTIESGLGTYTGNWNAFNVLASQAVLDSPLARREMAKFWPDKQKATLSKPEFDQRLRKRASWAREELASLLRLARQWGVSPHSVRGSAAGALGMSQFMPSNIGRYGLDGDGDGRVDLFTPADAIYSVGNYLKMNGWRAGQGRAQQAQVVYTYNHSQPYVDAVLNLAERIQ